MNIQDLRIFVRVAAAQNLSAVGLELGLTPGTISKRLQALEDDLGARLFDRSTRFVRITEEGSRLLVHAERILDEVGQARASVEQATEHLTGRLKLCAPSSLGPAVMAPIANKFMALYPGIELTVDIVDRPVNLSESGYDVVIRDGELADSSLIKRRLVPDTQVVVASPDYIRQHGAPSTLEDIERHACLVTNDTRDWMFSRNSARIAIRVNARFRSNNSGVLRRAAIDGHGLLMTSLLRVHEDIWNKRLTRLLADHEQPESASIYAMYSGSKHMMPKLRTLIDFLSDQFRDFANGRNPELGASVASL